MGLVTGHGPLSSAPAGWFAPRIPPGATYVEPHPRRVRALRDGRALIDTERALLVHRPDRPLSFAFRAEETHGLPSVAVPEAPGYVEVPWDAVDSWLEEGRTLVHYPPNPYHRVDCRPTKRRLRVAHSGGTLVDTDDTMIVFETALDAQLYVDPAHVHVEMLRRSETTTYCNYKGWATYWSTTDVDDVAWSYLDPPPESSPIKGYIGFDADRVDVTAELPGRDPGGA